MRENFEISLLDMREYDLISVNISVLCLYIIYVTYQTSSNKVKDIYTYISNARQIALLKKCLEIISDIRYELEMDVPVDLMQINIQLLWETLGEITGQVYKDDLLDEIFSKFCLGK